MSGMLSLCGVTADDVVYTVLPLYHVMGLVLGVLGCLELGKPFPDDPSNAGGCQTGVTRPHRLPSTLGLPFTAESPRRICTEAGTPT